jgi:hypothetical protein
MQILQIINEAGPLPVKAQFNAPVDGPALFAVTGTAWSSSEDVLLQMNVQLDGTQIGTAQIFSNGEPPRTARSPHYLST